MNIFVVEDERWALAELETLLARYEPEHGIYAFDNGDDALAAAADLRPSLVLTDINMPGIDGLELIEQLTKLDSAVKCMILSVHDEFEYARQGMQFGVGDYLLKPVKKEVLYQAVDKALHQLEQEHRRRDAWVNGSLAQMLLAEDDSVPDAELGREWNERLYAVVLLSLEKAPQIKGWKAAAVDFDAWFRRLAQPPYPDSLIQCVDLDCRQRVLLVPMAAAAQTAALQPVLLELFEQLRQLPVPAHMAIALKEESVPLRQVYTGLKESLEEHAVFGAATCLPFGAKPQEAELLSAWDKVRIMEVHCKKGELLKGQETLGHIVDEMRLKRVTKRQLRLFIQDVLFSLKYHLLSSGGDKISLNDLQEDVRCLNDFTGYGELFDWLKEKLFRLYCVRPEPQDLNPKGLVPVLLQHIHAHYQNPISLQQFAAEHHVSLGYLSRMFKSQTGTTFSDYIAGYRIRKAQELLAGGIERLQEVSRLVGYEDTKHFSALFKKFVGVSPMTYARKRPTTK
ncbi:response regulator [Paenibacillus doosanensis]|uniref:response regulator n=1 Tax=Paenibacillus doosanensis TaxID=1229154 RepID=UPI00217F909F|nr:response regulator [Paenibacillus doosanensis]MCS7462805.1 response regulator [Paenibacillus doosanensis]